MAGRTGQAIALAFAAGALLLASACTVDGSGSPAAAPPAAITTGSSAASTPVTPSPGAGSGSASASAAPITAMEFVAPSGNIACSDFPATDAVAGPQTPTMTACKILSANFNAPDEADCPIEKGIIVSLPKDGPATISGCTGDRGLGFPKSFFDLNAQRTLTPTSAYGDVIALKFARCTITPAHVECVSASSSYGFDLARESFTPLQR